MPQTFLNILELLFYWTIFCLVNTIPNFDWQDSSVGVCCQAWWHGFSSWDFYGREYWLLQVCPWSPHAWARRHTAHVHAHTYTKRHTHNRIKTIKKLVKKILILWILRNLLVIASRPIFSALKKKQQKKNQSLILGRCLFYC